MYAQTALRKAVLTSQHAKQPMEKMGAGRAPPTCAKPKERKEQEEGRGEEGARQTRGRKGARRGETRGGERNKGKRGNTPKQTGSVAMELGENKQRQHCANHTFQKEMRLGLCLQWWVNKALVGLVASKTSIIHRP